MSVAHVEGSKNEAKYDFNEVLENERQEIVITNQATLSVIETGQ